jgi:hypothetical protein
MKIKYKSVLIYIQIILILIQMAQGIYDLLNFEQLKLKIGLKVMSHENQEGSKAVSIESLPLRMCRQGLFLYFQSGSFFISAKNYSATYNRKNCVFS